MANEKKAAVGFIFITLLIDTMGFGLIIPVLPKLIAELKNISVNQASAYGGLLLSTLERSSAEGNFNNCFKQS